MKKNRKPMTDVDFEMWKNLPYHISINYFSWAMENGIDLDDMVQEGNIALLDSWMKFNKNHKSKSSFITYAFSAVYCRIAKYVKKCNKYSSIFHSQPDIWLLDIQEKPKTEFDKKIESEWVKHCTKLLRGILTRSEYKMLMERFSGKSYKEIGESRGYTRESARHAINKIMVKASEALLDEEKNQ